VADLGVVIGPSVISSENVLLRGSVLMNVRGRVGRFVDEAQRAVAHDVKMPPGYYIEWSGQCENQIRAKKCLELVIPVVFLIMPEQIPALLAALEEPARTMVLVGVGMWISAPVRFESNRPATGV
jgi:Cu/Ag efflux pump CusA